MKNKHLQRLQMKFGHYNHMTTTFIWNIKGRKRCMYEQEQHLKLRSLPSPISQFFFLIALSSIVWFAPFIHLMAFLYFFNTTKQEKRIGEKCKKKI